MSQDAYPGDRSGDVEREDDQPQSGGAPMEGGPKNSDGGFTPTDLARLFGESEETPLQIDPSHQRPASEGERDPQWLTDRNAERENITPRKLYEKEVKVSAVYEQTAITGQRAFFVQLRDNAGREMKVYVGFPEATSISMAAEGVNYRRPLTHDLTRSIIERLGWSIDRATVDDLYNETFYAKLTLSRGQEVIDIDCRSSDAIALALRARAPIYVAEEVLASASHEESSGEEGNTSE